MILSKSLLIIFDWFYFKRTKKLSKQITPMHSWRKRKKGIPFCIVLRSDQEEEGLDGPDGGGGITSGVVLMGDSLWTWLVGLSSVMRSWCGMVVWNGLALIRFDFPLQVLFGFESFVVDLDFFVDVRFVLMYELCLLLVFASHMGECYCCCILCNVLVLWEFCAMKLCYMMQVFCDGNRSPFSCSENVIYRVKD